MAENINFEKSLAELEEIVKKLEGGNISLDEMLKYFEQGTKLVADCNKVLDETEAKLNILMKKDGEIVKNDFALPEE
ncbi:MAG: exodeoxyribonuclease VII small subunit [Clostridia bacterium]|nr:exodeoxyribonuclease VII small subunit [Clostridia bacterium]